MGSMNQRDLIKEADELIIKTEQQDALEDERKKEGEENLNLLLSLLSSK